MGINPKGCTRTNASAASPGISQRRGPDAGHTTQVVYDFTIKSEKKEAEEGPVTTIVFAGITLLFIVMVLIIYRLETSRRTEEVSKVREAARAAWEKNEAKDRETAAEAEDEEDEDEEDEDEEDEDEEDEDEE